MSHIWYTFGLFMLVVDITFSCCSDGWIRFGESCYLFGHEDQSFLDAQRYCQHFQAGLANIESATENAMLRSHLSDLKAPDHWIGLTDTLIENVWKYYPSEITAQYLGWNPGEPNGEKQANCAAFREHYGYNWVDDPCSNKYRALCKKPAASEAIIG